MINNSFAIAIDGPGGAGKSSIARELAKRLQMIYIDTGAMYRAVGLYSINHNNDFNNPDVVNMSLTQIKIELKYQNGLQHLYINGDDVTRDLYTQKVAESASVVATYTPVRAFLLTIQRALAQNNRVVMDGRDIGSHVLPWAQVKIYLDANIASRVKRRVAELETKGEACDPVQIRKEIEIRDERDMNRAAAPLIKAEDAVYIDTSDLDINQVVDKIIMIVNSK